MINEEIRNYEVSIWTLQDEFLTVLKWPNVENKGTIQDPKMVLSDDGTQSFSFTIPMYIYENGKFTENPIWYNTINGNLMVGMRKIRVIFNKENYSAITGLGSTSAMITLYNEINNLQSAIVRDYILELINTYRITTTSGMDTVISSIRAYEASEFSEKNKENLISLLREAYTQIRKEQVFDFLITKITEEHEADHLFCNIECEGLAFHELGKIGYIYDLSQADVENDYQQYQTKGFWKDYNDQPVNSMPKATVDYWCNKIGLEKYPASAADINPRKWYYKVKMDWSSYSDYFERSSSRVYDDEHIIEWSYSEMTNHLTPIKYQKSQEKERIIEVKESNIYNITQKIAETFEIFCRYEYTHDSNYQITSRTVVFFNNYIHDESKSKIENVMTLTYPHTSSKISREMDSQNIVTKLYVKSMEDSTTYLGEATIRYCNANKSQEDYIFNFDYMKEVGAINDEQYNAIEEYEAYMHKYNTDLYPIENKINFYSNEITTLSAKKTVYENSIKLDQEQYDSNSALALNLENGDGVIVRDNKTPDTAIITQDKQGNYCINLNTKNKGIHTDTVALYRTYNSATQTLDTPISNFSFSYDADGNPTGIYGIAPNTDPNAIQPNMVYMTYSYEPKLYYDNIAKSWQEKLAVDQQHLNELLLKIGYDRQSNNVSDMTEELYNYYAPLLNINTPYSSRTSEIEYLILTKCHEGLYDQLEEAKSSQEQIINKKKKLLQEFNEMMGPALREGYWQPEDYQDYGERKEATHNFVSPDTNMMYSNLGDDFEVGWSENLFDEEQDIYYESGINQTRIYYPCINLSRFMANTTAFNKFRANLSEYSFIFNNNYYNENADKNNIKNIRSFSIGSEAILGFVKNSSNNIYPVLILVGAKNMTRATDSNPIVEGGTIGFMEDSRGNPRIGKIKSTINGSNVTTTITDAFSILPADFSFFGTDIIDDCKVVYPRIRFTSLMLKVNEDDLFIRYNNTLLKNYEHYYIRNRTNPNSYEPEYLITLKPEVIIKTGSVTGSININYALSNAGTAIYLDAQDIEKENAYPKVSYTIDPNILDKRIMAELYNKLNWLVMINDVQLKFENVFGYISKIELDLDFPDKDSIEVKNYKTKFEDLFSSIVASTESLQANSKMLSSLATGTYSLSGAGLASTIENNLSLFNTYLDKHLEESETFESVLENLFNDAGAILGETNQILNNTTELASKNASILGGFAQRISEELAPHIFRQRNQPGGFKQGDIWIEVDQDDQEIARYVATANASDSRNERGWVKTCDGSLAQIQGAAINIDAVSGNVDIVTTYYGEDDPRNVDIDTGILLMATAISTNESSLLSKVQIKPQKISMFGSSIDMITGNVTEEEGTGVSAITLDSENGIYIGSNKGITMYSGAYRDNNGDLPVTSSSANVEMNADHILFGMNSATDVTALEMTKDYVIIGARNAISNLENGEVSWINSLNGLKITSTSFGLAIANSDSRTIFEMGATGLIVGSIASNSSAALSGAYVKILSTGTIDIGGSGNLKLNTNNIVLDSTAQNDSAIFQLRKLVNGNYVNYLTYTANGNLTIKAASITLGTDTTPITSSSQFQMTDAQIWAGVKNATSGTTTALTIADSLLYLDVDDTNYIHIDTSGIAMWGKHIYINGNAEWSREDIIFQVDKPNGPSDRPWIWIKPQGESTLPYAQSGGSDVWGMTGGKCNRVTLSIQDQNANYFAPGTGSPYYVYSVYASVRLNYNPGDAKRKRIFCYASTSNDGTSEQYLGHNDVIFANVGSTRSDANFSISATITPSGNPNANVGTGPQVYLYFIVIDKATVDAWPNWHPATCLTTTDPQGREGGIQNSGNFTVVNSTLNASTPASSAQGTSGVPCNVYYFDPR